MAVIPGVMGLCLFSPPVNKNGNSVRGLRFCEVREEQCTIESELIVKS